jgi:hypothetical protein
MCEVDVLGSYRAVNVSDNELVLTKAGVDAQANADDTTSPARDSEAGPVEDAVEASTGAEAEPGKGEEEGQEAKKAATG